MKIDLHTHSNYSMDSSLEVSTLLQMAKDNNIDVFAIADHNAVKGSLEAMKDTDIDVISAIEIDCHFEDIVIHILGYGIDLENKWILNVCEKYPSELKKVAKKTVEILEKKYNCKIDEEELLRLGNGSYSHVEIIKYLLKNVKNDELLPYQSGNRSENPIANYYWDNCSCGKWCYVKMDLPDAQDVINELHKAKGIAICAHPKITIGKDYALMDKLVGMGIDGYEVYSSYHDTEDINFYLNYCISKDLIITCGSDYHGANKPSVKFGVHGFDGDATEIVSRIKKGIEKYR